MIAVFIDDRGRFNHGIDLHRWCRRYAYCSWAWTVWGSAARCWPERLTGIWSYVSSLLFYICFGINLRIIYEKLLHVELHMEARSFVRYSGVLISIGLIGVLWFIIDGAVQMDVTVRDVVLFGIVGSGLCLLIYIGTCASALPMFRAVISAMKIAVHNYEENDAATTAAIRFAMQWTLATSVATVGCTCTLLRFSCIFGTTSQSFYTTLFSPSTLAATSCL